MLNDYKKYVGIFLSIFFAFIIIVVLISFYIQPLEGELTRLGSYSERDFGWNLPQKKIKKDANTVNIYDGKRDVLIIGDSFSTNGIWQPFFRAKTDLTFETLDIRKTTVNKFLENKEFKKYPPKIMILQCVERELIYFFKDIKITCDRNHKQPFLIHVQKQPDYIHAAHNKEKRKTFDIQNINLNYTASVVLHSLIRAITGKDTRPTKRFSLTDRNLFSNRKNNEILLYEDDMNKLLWTKNDIEKTAFVISCLQNKVQSSGNTLFIFMLVPDKSTAYADYIATNVFKNRDNVWEYLTKKGVNLPRIDSVLKTAIDHKEKDIYTPNGTHWSARGYELAAETLAEFIRGKSISYQ